MLRALCLALLLAQAAAAEPPPHAVGVVTVHGGASGTVVAAAGGKSLVVTNKHVVGRDEKVFVVAAGKTYPARFLAAHPLEDLSVVEVAGQLPPAALAPTDPGEGEAVTHHGRASGPQAGTVKEYSTHLEAGAGVTSLTNDTLTVPGDSGAGVFDARGRLVGVCYAHKGNPDEFGDMLCVRVAVVRRFLRGAAPARYATLHEALK